VKAVHVVVRGVVQGVNFRWSAVRAAQRIGVTGWVRNRDDGAVEAHVEGDDGHVLAMLAWLREGPAAATVEGVDVTDAEVDGATGFQIRP